MGANQTTLSGAIRSSNLEFRSGTLLGASTIGGTLNWTGGTISGTVTIPATSTLNISGDAAKPLSGGVINTGGTTYWTGAGNFNLNNNATFNNTGDFNVQTDASLVQIGGGTSTFTNQGTFTRSGTPGMATVQLGRFSNTGIVDVQTGTLVFFTVFNVTSSGAGSSFHTAPCATLAFSGGAPVVENLTNDGTLMVNSGSSLNVNATLTNLAGMTLTGGTFVIGGTLTLPSADGIVTNAAAFVLDGSSAQVLTSSGGNRAGDLRHQCGHRAASRSRTAAPSRPEDRLPTRGT